MICFEKWPTLKEIKGFALLDFLFAQTLLKSIPHHREEHVALAATLFAASRQGHLMLPVEPGTLSQVLMQLFSEEIKPLEELIVLGADTFPAEGLYQIEESRPLDSAISNRWIYRFRHCFYLQKHWLLETAILKHLHRLHHASIERFSVPSDLFRLNSAQALAVKKALQSPLLFLTGGPGTGKTYTAAQIVQALFLSASRISQIPFRILLAAPTGKAVAQLEGTLAKYIPSSVQIEAGTLHALLRLRSAGRGEEEISPLCADLIVVDECSMIDVKVFARLLKAVQTGTRLILIGDPDQIPPVEAGSVFAQIINVPSFEKVALEHSLRSDQQEILKVSSLIKSAQVDQVWQMLSSQNIGSVTYVDLQNLSSPYEWLWQHCHHRFFGSFSKEPNAEELFSHLGAFVLLCCLRQGELGADALNRFFLKKFSQKVLAEQWWAAPIMITKNTIDMALYNGDVGILVRKARPNTPLHEIGSEDYALFMDRTGKEHRKIAALALPAFDYCYALSVHKSQGSEYDEVLILAPEGAERFGREVLYTAVTRARQRVTIMSSELICRKTIAKGMHKLSGLSMIPIADHMFSIPVTVQGDSVKES